MKILLVDDHVLVREGIRFMLLRYDDKAVVVEAESCNQAEKYCRSENDFDVIFLDYMLPDSKESSCLKKLRAIAPHTPIIIMSALEEPEVIKKLISQGAKGYVPKSSSSDIMFSALNLVMSGGIYVPPQALQINDKSSQKETDEVKSLTTRQKQVLVLLGQGYTNKEIARELFLSDATIRTHVSEIFRVLEVHNRTQAGRIAAEMGII